MRDYRPPGTQMLGMRVYARPFAGVELGLSRHLQWGGEGRPRGTRALADAVLARTQRRRRRARLRPQQRAGRHRPAAGRAQRGRLGLGRPCTADRRGRGQQAAIAAHRHGRVTAQATVVRRPAGMERRRQRHPAQSRIRPGQRTCAGTGLPAWQLCRRLLPRRPADRGGHWRWRAAVHARPDLGAGLCRRLQARSHGGVRRSRQ